MITPRPQWSCFLRLCSVAVLTCAAGVHVFSQGDGWSVYDGFDYRTPGLDGSDGGAGAWKTEWRRSAVGGVVLAEPGFDFAPTSKWRLASVGRRAEINSNATAGSYRDFDYKGTDAAGGGQMVFWFSFLARAKGAPFEAGADEVSFQLRAAKDVPLLTIGVMGRLNEWRIRAEGLAKQYSRGAEKRPPENLSWIVVRVDVDHAPNAPDAVYLWVNPTGSREPSTTLPNARIIGTDLWNAERPFLPERLRIGTIAASKNGPAKRLEWDEVRMGRDFASVAPAAPQPRN